MAAVALEHAHAPSLLGSPLQTANGCLYFDWNATTPVFPEVRDAMLPYLSELWGNPSSSHAYGRPCKAAVDLARQRVAALIHAQPEEL
jgi:cysteine desulfurase